jgi:hypothetical protein
MKRPCNLCGKEVDFSEPWCDHETMEESAWLDIQSRMIRRAEAEVIDDVVGKTAQELGKRAGEDLKWKLEE